MYIAGTRTFSDVVQDLNIPLGRTTNIQRYLDSERLLKMCLSNGHPVDRIVGHSMGGSVALELSKRYGIRAITYGAPVVSSTPGERYRDLLDPISIFDWGASTVGLGAHSTTIAARQYV